MSSSLSDESSGSSSSSADSGVDVPAELPLVESIAEDSSSSSSSSSSIASTTDEPKGETSVEKRTEAEEKEDEEEGDDEGDDDEEEISTETGPKASFFALFAYASWVDIILMLLGILGGIGVGMALPSFSLVFGEILDSFNFAGANVTNVTSTSEPVEKVSVFDETKKWSFYFIYIGVAAFILALIQHSMLRLAAHRQVHRMRGLYVNKLMRMDISWFDARSATSLVTRLNSDLDMIESALGEEIAKFVQFFSTFVFGFALGFWQGWELSLLLVGIAPFLALAGALIMKIVSSSQSKEQEAYGAAGAVAAEILGSFRTVVGLVAERQMLDRYAAKLTDATRAEVKKGLFQGIGSGSVWAIFFFAYAASFAFGFWLVHNRSYTGGKVLMVLFSVLIGAFALGQAVPALQALTKARSSAWHVFDTIETIPTIDPLSVKGKKLRKVKGAIRFNKVKFAYPTRSEQAILKNFSFDIPAGKTVAFVGESGCGKSTTLGLIQRFYDSDAGIVSLDGVDVRKLNVAWLRRQIGVVAQEPVLFAGTIRENIAFGAIQEIHEEETMSLKELLQAVPMKQIRSAAKKAFVHDFVESFPDGYETYIGESGAQMSGGQKQRIAIARAILKDPRILLLDEATSALDSQSEKIVQKALLAASKGRTTVVVAHRLSTIRDVDTIFVVENGQIVESGSHDQLLEQERSKYHALWTAQMTGSEREAKANLRASGSDGLRKSLDESNLFNSGVEDSVEFDAERQEDKQEDAAKAPAVPMRRLLSLSRPESVWLIVGTFGAILNGCIMPSFALIFSEFITLFYLPEEEAKDEVTYWALGFAGVGVATIIANTLQFGAFGISGARLTERLRLNILRSVLENEVGFFDFKENEPNVVAEKLATQTTKVQGAVGPRLGMAVMNIVVIAYGLGLAFANGPLLTLVVLGTLPIVSIGQMLEMRMTAGMSAGTGKVLEAATAQVAEAVQKIRTTASFTREALIVYDYSRALDAAVPRQTRFHFLAGAAAGLSQGGMILIYGPIMLFGAFLVDEGVMTFKQVLIVFFAIVMMGMSVGQAMSFAPDMADVGRATKQVLEIIDREPLLDAHGSIDDVEGDFSWKGKRLRALRRSGIQSAIFKETSFAYPARPEATVLSKFSVDIGAGKVIAFVGSSGNGKSTCVQLLQRFYDTDGGTLEILGKGDRTKGVDIKDLPARWLRRQLGVVSQEPVLFSGTIAENLRIGNPSLSKQDMVAACKGALAHGFIKGFPKQYDTEVGEKGAQLSGGQKQRIAIARALARSPKLLLLDEATSALDSQSEAEVQQTLDKVMVGRSTVIVAHRLSTIRNADEIVVMELGRVAERGTHEELMQKHGAYYALVKRQTEN